MTSTQRSGPAKPQGAGPPFAWRHEVEALLERRTAPARKTGVRDAAVAWARSAGDPHAVEVLEEPDVPESASQVILPGTLVDAADPAALLGRIADVLRPGGEVVVAVPWCVPVEDALRALHPGALLGLLVERFAVEQLVADDGVLGARARVERDADARERAATAALLDVQTDVERHLDLWSRSKDVVRALEAADRSSLEAVATVEADAREARLERDAARQALRDAREQQAAEVQRLRGSVERLTAHRDAARVHAAAAQRRADAMSARLERVERSRWWRIRGVLVQARGRPKTWWRVPLHVAEVVRGAR